jgi:hypothetical protein
MTDLESRLHEALVSDGQAHPPAPDLFARVTESIEADRARRRRLRWVLAGWAAAVAALTTLVLTLTPRDSEGMHMPWWILEIGTTLLLVGLALWLGPFIKRFGRAYAADVFHDNPMTGKSYIVLTDVVYYLIFGAYILFTVTTESPSFDNQVTADQVKNVLARIGGILLIIGVLHGINIVMMPVLGRLFSLNRRLPGDR